MQPSARVSRLAGLLLQRAAERKLHFKIDLDQARSLMQLHDLNECIRLIREQSSVKLSGTRGEIKKEIADKLIPAEIMAKHGDADAMELRKAAIDKSDRERALQEKNIIFADYCSDIVAVRYEIKRFTKRAMDHYQEMSLLVDDRIKSASDREQARLEIAMAVNESINKASLLCRMKLASVCEKYERTCRI